MEPEIPPSLFNALQLAMQPYRANWQEWISEPGCFLEKEDILIINAYLRSASYSTCALELNLDEIDIYFRLKTIIFRMLAFGKIS